MLTLCGAVYHKQDEFMEDFTLKLTSQTFSQAIAAIAFALLSMPALADGEAANEVEAKLSASIVRMVGNKEVLELADKAKPGDVIEYSVVYRNPSKPVKGVLATLPVPQSMEYIAGSAAPKTATASLDGNTCAAIPLKHQVKLADGKTVEQLVPYNEYRFLQWKLGDMPNKASFKVSARMRVSAASTSAAPTNQQAK